MIDDNYSELTMSNSVNHSGNLDARSNKFALYFSTSQFPDRKSFMSKRKFQIELYNTEDGQIIARSQVFRINQLLKTIGRRSTIQNISAEPILFNNLNLNSEGKEYDKII